MKNNGYGYFRFKDKDGKEFVRKPTPKQRKIMLTYYLRRRSGRTMTVKSIAKAFCVSERTLQKLLKELETEKIIKRSAVYNEIGRQTANKIEYIGAKPRLKGNECTLDKIYDIENPLHLRDFEWTGFWLFADDQYDFFNYEKLYGAEGPSNTLNEIAERHGYIATDHYTGEKLPKLNIKKRTIKKKP